MSQLLTSASKVSAQISVNAHEEGYRPKDGKTKIDKYMRMRKHPTINLARKFAFAPVLLEPWSFEGEDDALVGVVQNAFMPLRQAILRLGLSGYHDFGWRGAEIIWELQDLNSTVTQDHPEERGGLRDVPIAIKPLRNSRTYQRIDSETGRYLGLVHDDYIRWVEVYLDPGNSLFFNFDEDGYGEYGVGSAAVAEVAYDEWMKANEGAARYDDKVAGTYRIVYYPTGTTPFDDGSGNVEELPNKTIADRLGQSLISSGIATIPIHYEEDFDSGQAQQAIQKWKVELLNDGAGAQPSFISRLKYLDALLMRAYETPERAATEGSFGTKAEAEAHGDIALANAHLVHEWILATVNQTMVDEFVRRNYGEPVGTVRIKAGDLDEQKRAVFLDLFKTLLTTTNGAEASEHIDVNAMLQQVGVPFVDMSEVDDETKGLLVSEPDDTGYIEEEDDNLPSSTP